MHSVLKTGALFCTVAILLIGCSTTDEDPEAVSRPYPELREQALSSQGIISATRSVSDINPAWQVNGFLWRAALDTFSFMPIKSADPLAGTIRTGWYADPSAATVRYRLEVVITGAALVPDALRVSVFEQKFNASIRKWRSTRPKSALVRNLEDAVLQRARSLRVAALNLQ